MAGQLETETIIRAKKKEPKKNPTEICQGA
jgi:hypothetical protein